MAFSERAWAEDFLGRLRKPTGQSNQDFTVAWELAEGGHRNGAMWNPLNTTQRMPGSTRFNSVGVQSYPDYETGMAATVKTITNGYYDEILAALDRGDNGLHACDTVIRSPWGTGPHLRRVYLDLIIPALDDSPPGDPTVLRGRPSPRPQAAMAAGPQRAPAVMPEVQATDVLAFYERNDGLAEIPDGSNRNWLTTWWGLFDAWCAMTFSRGLMEAGFRSGDDYSTMVMPGIQRTQAKGWQYVPAMARCFADAGWFGDVPRVGAAAIAVWSDWTWRDPTWRMPGDHVCCVELVLDAGGSVVEWGEDGYPSDPGAVSSVVTWDGNISNRIMRAHRSAGTYFGYGYPPYAGHGQGADDMNAEQAGQLRHLVDIAEEWKETIGWLGYGDDPWQPGRHAFIDGIREEASRSKAIEAKLDALATEVARLKAGGGGTGSGTVEVDYARIRREVADELFARLEQ